MSRVLRSILIAVFLYFFVLLQASFLPHFRIFGLAAVFIFIMVMLVNFFEMPKNYSGIFLAFWGGLLLDIFSSGAIGRNLPILLVIAIFTKLLLKKYVRAPIRQF